MGNSLLIMAVSKNDLPTVKRLLNSGTDVNEKGLAPGCGPTLYTPLVFAAKEGFVEICDTLLKSPDIDVNGQDGNGRTALHHASCAGHARVVELLLRKREVNVNVRSSQDSEATPLHLAVIKSHEECVKLLLEKDGINVNATDKDNDAPIHLAAFVGNEEVVKLLLKCPSIDVNKPAREHRYTALHAAAMSRNTKIVRLLVTNAETDIDVKDSQGRTFLDFSGTPKVPSLQDLLSLLSN